MNRNLIIIIVAVILLTAGFISIRLITHDPARVQSVETINPENLRHLTMKIDGMYCASCPYNVENAIKDTPGVINVTVGFVGKEIINGTVEGRGEVVYDTTKTSPDKMIQAILPYKGAILSDGATNSTELTPLSKTFWL